MDGALALQAARRRESFNMLEPHRSAVELRGENSPGRGNARLAYCHQQGKQAGVDNEACQRQSRRERQRVAKNSQR